MELTMEGGNLFVPIAVKCTTSRNEFEEFGDDEFFAHGRTLGEDSGFNRIRSCLKKIFGSGLHLG